jgi:hypothetical protein
MILGATVFRDQVAGTTALAEEVTVNNTPAQAVPVREQNLDANGNIAIHEQGTAQVAGTIGIDPSANSVVIGNSASDPVPVALQPPPLEPVQETVTVGLGTGETDDQEPLFTVPAGKRLIVDFVSANGALGANALVLAEVKVGSGLFVPRVTLPLSKTRDSGPFLAAEAVTLYAEAGETVFARFVHNPGGTSSVSLVAHFTVAGHLVDAPSN